MSEYSYLCPVCRDTGKLPDGNPCNYCYAIKVDTSCSACKAKDGEIAHLRAWLEEAKKRIEEALAQRDAVCALFEAKKKELEELKKISLKIEVTGDNELGNKISSVLMMLFPKVGG